MNTTLQAQFGEIDIYLFDQLLKGRFDSCRTVLDSGCGNGRNLVYFLRNNFEVFGIDPDPAAIAEVRKLAHSLGYERMVPNFTQAVAEDMPFPESSIDLVICNAVLHFARDEQHFEAMLQSMWRVLKPGGYFLARLASSIGIESLVKPVGNSRYLLPDRTERFLVTNQQLLDYGQKLGGHLFEPIKTTNVQNLRCMTTWCLQKSLDLNHQQTLAN